MTKPFLLIAIVACAACSGAGEVNPAPSGSQAERSTAVGATSSPENFLTETCDAYPASFDVEKELRWVALAPLNGSAVAGFPAQATLQTSSPPPESLVSSIEATLRLYDLDNSQWVGTLVERDTSSGPTFLRWKVKPIDPSLRGRFVLRVGPLPDEAIFARGEFFVCHGVAETRFSVVP